MDVQKRDDPAKGRRRTAWAVLFDFFTVLAFVGLLYCAMTVFMLFGTGSICSINLNGIALMGFIGLGIIIFIVPPFKAGLLDLIEKKKLDMNDWKRPLISVIVMAVLFTAFGGLLLNEREKARKRIFKLFVADPIPASVKILDARFSSWLDFSGDIIFEIDEKHFNEIVKDYRVASPEGSEILTYYKEVPLERGPDVEARQMVWDKNKRIASFNVKNTQYTKYMVARDNIPKGTVVTLDMLDINQTTWEYEHQDFNPIGYRTKVDINKGEYIEKNMFEWEEMK
jgi:hypothetical protein